LRKLTIINVVFLPLNLIASIGGMSEFTMMTRSINWRTSYFLFLAAMVLIGWLTAFFLGRMNFGGNIARKKK
ncbi:MAG TPA: magnesium transporter CorA family protein, partial [candidate division Zixibacteria bacterium]|nr:magnesium transporter CorA family protein [candidate division Zixibacteria bacterium]